PQSIALSPPPSPPRPPRTLHDNLSQAHDQVGSSKGEISRRQVLFGSCIAASLISAGGVAWLAWHREGPFFAVPTTRTRSPWSPLPARLASLGFVVQAAGSTSYIAPPMAAIPAGTLLLGSDLRIEVQAFGNETPRTTLTLGAFQIAKHPVTVAEYAAFVQQADRNMPGNWATQQQTPDHPVVAVSWNDAGAYARWLTQVS